MLYIGVAADLASRITQHKNGKGSQFCRRYGLDRLVLAEHHADIRDPIAREKAMKALEARLEDRTDRGGQPGMARFVSASRGTLSDPSIGAMRRLRLRWDDDLYSSPLAGEVSSEFAFRRFRFTTRSERVVEKLPIPTSWRRKIQK